MSTVYLVWNDDRSECVGFTDKADALQASGDEGVGVFAGGSTLAEFFRSNYADEYIFEEPERVFEVQEVELP